MGDRLWAQQWHITIENQDIPAKVGEGGEQLLNGVASA
jgi:hypothetical protein